MDFYVAVLTVSPVLLVAMAAAHRGRIFGLPAILGGAMTAIVMLPAMAAILFSLIMLATEQDFPVVRGIVAIAALMQAGVSVYSVVAEMARPDTAGVPLVEQSAGELTKPAAETAQPIEGAVEPIHQIDEVVTAPQSSSTTPTN